MPRKWSIEEVETLELLYPHLPTFDVAGIIGRSRDSVEQKAYKMSVKKTEEYIQGQQKQWLNAGKSTRFKKGNKSWNKGTKGLTSSNKTSFKKGHKPHNHRSVGTEVVTFDGYIKVKIAEPRTWELKHRLQWEKHNGPIPEGYNVQFRNGNRKDCRIENLYLIDKAGNMQKNTIQRYPDDIKNVLRRNAKLKRVIKKMETQENE
jgi:hypothetical protein